MFLNLYMSFVLHKDVTYLLRTVLAYLCATKPFQVFIVLIAVPPAESRSKAKGMCGSCEGTVGEFER